ncbi:MAG: FAD-dependent oxidoreductase [Lacunisphaera sp.]
MCLTNRARQSRPFVQPAGYDRAAYELLIRYLRGGWGDVFAKFDAIPHGKTDTNNHGAFSTDFIGANHAWPEAGYAERERIFQAHVTYQQGLQWFLANDPAVPARIRDAYAQWGLPRDEFPETGGWPHALYVREARRLLGDYVMTEHDCRGARRCPDPVALGAYGMDSHNCRRIVRDGRVWNEGDVQAAGFPPYPISYRAIVPRRGDCTNLFAPSAFPPRTSPTGPFAWSPCS